MALLLTTLAIGGLTQFVESGLGTTHSTLSKTALDSKSARALGRIAKELQLAQFESLTPQDIAPLSSSTIDFRRPAGHAPGQMLWRPTARLLLRPRPSDPPDGVDNDGNGLVDEHEIVLIEAVGTPGEEEQVLVRGVARYLQGESANALDDNGNGLVDEAGFCLVFEDGAIQVRLTLEGQAVGGNHVAHTVETTIRPRN